MQAIILNRRQLGAMALSTLAAASARAASAPAFRQCIPAPIGLPKALGNLVAAYPDFLSSADEQTLRWKDGFRMPVSLYPPSRTMPERIRNPDLASQLSQAYPKGDCGIPQDPATDPGRIRYDPFFARMYGNDRNAVQRNLVKVSWPTRRKNGVIEFNRANGAAEALKRVSAELERLPADLHRFFDRPAGGFYWRQIAGTDRMSGHAYGIAIDINVSLSDYWRNELHGVTGEPDNWRATRPRNRIPFDIVDIFERHGFIWGGKWYHYDTMHFEYRPELLSP